MYVSAIVHANEVTFLIMITKNKHANTLVNLISTFYRHF